MLDDCDIEVVERGYTMWSIQDVGKIVCDAAWRAGADNVVCRLKASYAMQTKARFDLREPYSLVPSPNGGSVVLCTVAVVARAGGTALW